MIHVSMILTPGSQVYGRRIVKTLGLVKGNTIRARHLGKDIVAVFKNIVGGEIEEYTKMLAEAREQALDRMRAEAHAMGANAVVDVRFSTSYIMGAASEIMAYGNAVVLDNE
jgi:uncharacterized protein YbjQ (UPF0145 family)